MEIIKDGVLYDMNDAKIIAIYARRILFFTKKYALMKTGKGNWVTVECGEIFEEDNKPTIDLNINSLKPIEDIEAREILEDVKAIDALKEHFIITER